MYEISFVCISNPIGASMLKKKKNQTKSVVFLEFNFKEKISDNEKFTINFYS